MTDKIVVLTTCGSQKEAQRIARALVESRLAACANVLRSPVQAIYRWKGQVESAKEFMLIIKTSRTRFRALEKKIRQMHSYNVPEIIAVPIASGSRDYLKWLADSVRPARK